MDDEITSSQADEKDDDNFIWCEECNNLVLPPCSFHGDLLVLKDKPIPTRARLSLPHHLIIKCTEMRACNEHIYGVFAKKMLQARTRFGPYEGKLTETWNCVREDRIPLKLFFPNGRNLFLDCTDENICNWMMFVRPAEKIEQQNMVVFQFQGAVYFVTTRSVSINEELRVWYASHYAKKLNKSLLEDSSRRLAHTPDGMFDQFREDISSDRTSKAFILSSIPRNMELISAEPFNLQKSSTLPNIVVDEADSEDNCSGSMNYDKELHIHSVCSQDCSLAESTTVQTSLPENVESTTCENDTNKVLNLTLDKKSIEKGRNDLKVYKRSSSRLKGSKLKNTKTYHSKQSLSKARSCLVKEMYQKTRKESSLSEKTKSKLQKEKPQNRILECPPQQKNHPKKCGRKPKQEQALHVCEICGKVFYHASKLKSHYFIHSGERTFECSVSGCNKTFYNKFKLKRHMVIHTDTRTFACVYCDKSFNRKDHLKNHLAKVHNPNKNLHNCQECGKNYASSFSFRTHLSHHAAERGELQCLVCDDAFDSSKDLLHHLKFHSGARSVKNSDDKKHKCDKCDKNFFTKKDVARHMVTHTKTRNFMCHFCPQSFLRRDHLVRHLKATHDKERINKSLDKKCVLVKTSDDDTNVTENYKKVQNQLDNATLQCVSNQSSVATSFTIFSPSSKYTIANAKKKTFDSDLDIHSTTSLKVPSTTSDDLNLPSTNNIYSQNVSALFIDTESAAHLHSSKNSLDGSIKEISNEQQFLSFGEPLELTFSSQN